METKTCGFSRLTWLVIVAIGVSLFIEFVKKGKLCTSEADLSGKTVIVTGGNIGIGYETALALAKRNAIVIIACRNLEKAKKAVELLKISSGKKSVSYLIVDFAEMEDIRRAAEEFMSKEKYLDILINNAAVVTGGKTRDGLDAMFGINHIGYFMFTNLLMPIMRKTAKKRPVRIINVSSEAYLAGTIDFRHLNPDITINASISALLGQYANTKLMNIYFTSELDARLKDEFKGQEQGITTYSLHPGTVDSNLGRDLTEERGFVSQMIRQTFLILIASPTVYGAQTSLCCATERGIEIHSGRFFSDLEPAQLSKRALHPKIGKKLWSVSEKLTGIRWPM